MRFLAAVTTTLLVGGAVASGLPKRSDALHARNGGLVVRQIGPDGEEFPAECQTTCNAASDTIEACDNLACQCLDANGQALTACVECLVDSADNSDDSRRSAQAVLDEFDLGCGNPEGTHEIEGGAPPPDSSTFVSTTTSQSETSSESESQTSTPPPTATSDEDDPEPTDGDGNDEEEGDGEEGAAQRLGLTWGVLGTVVMGAVGAILV